MNQRELYRAIACRTGESVRTIQQLGFSESVSGNDAWDADGSESEPQMVDWDRLERDRGALAILA
jgi:hypothetical protein